MEVLLLENFIYLAVFAANVHDETVLLFEDGVAERAFQIVHQVGKLILDLLHEMSAEMLLQQVKTVLLLFAHLTLQVKVAFLI